MASFSQPRCSSVLAAVSLSLVVIGCAVAAAGADFAHLRTQEHKNAAAQWLERNDTTDEMARALWFLTSHMPPGDRSMPMRHFTDTVELAFEARREFQWAKSVPWKIFVNDVLPYAALTEPRDPWRPMFYRHFRDQVKNLTSLHEVAVWMNANAWNIVSPPIVFEPGNSPTGLNEYSPFQVMAAGHASCTGLAVFIVSCLRSVGVPARIAGTPHWNLGPKRCPHGDASDDCGNHDWAEVWTEPGGWSFIDPRGNLNLNSSWFFPLWTEHQTPGTHNHSIFATSWAGTEHIEGQGGDDDPLAFPRTHFPMVWDWSNTVVPGWDVTVRYNRTV